MKAKVCVDLFLHTFTRENITGVNMKAKTIIKTTYLCSYCEQEFEYLTQCKEHEDRCFYKVKYINQNITVVNRHIIYLDKLLETLDKSDVLENILEDQK